MSPRAHSRLRLLGPVLALAVLGLPLASRAADPAGTKVASALEQARRGLSDDLAAVIRLGGLTATDPRVQSLAAQIGGDLSSSLASIGKRFGHADRVYRTSLDLGGGRRTEVLSTRPRPRVGFYPIAANPITIGHLALALRALAQGGLDHLIIVPAGVDARKPALTENQALRHKLVQRAIAGLPCLSYSPIARGSSNDGETNFTRWAQLNKGVQPVYLAGGDHDSYERNGQLDTLGKLAAARDSGALEARGTSAIIFRREGDGGRPTVAPPGVRPIGVRYLAAIPFSSSSTELRQALAGLGSGVAQPSLLLLPGRAARTLRTLAGLRADGTARPGSKSYAPARRYFQAP